MVVFLYWPLSSISYSVAFRRHDQYHRCTHQTLTPPAGNDRTLFSHISTPFVITLPATLFLPYLPTMPISSPDAALLNIFAIHTVRTLLSATLIDLKKDTNKTFCLIVLKPYNVAETNVREVHSETKHISVLRF